MKRVGGCRIVAVQALEAEEVVVEGHSDIDPLVLFLILHLRFLSACCFPSVVSGDPRMLYQASTDRAHTDCRHERSRRLPDSVRTALLMEKSGSARRLTSLAVVRYTAWVW